MIASDQDLDASSNGCISPMRRVWRDLVERRARRRSYRDSWRCWSRRKSRIASRAPGRLTRRARFCVSEDDRWLQFHVSVDAAAAHARRSHPTSSPKTDRSSSPANPDAATHLAIAVAYRAIQNGFDAFFTTAATFIDDLSAALRAGQLTDALQAYTHPAVLVVDEVRVFRVLRG
jgi:IstB-like ATP binding protein